MVLSIKVFQFFICVHSIITNIPQQKWSFAFLFPLKILSTVEFA